MGRFHLGDTFRFSHEGKSFLFVVQNAALMEVDPGLGRFLDSLAGARELTEPELDRALRQHYPPEELRDVVQGLLDFEILQPVSPGQFVPSAMLEDREPPPVSAITAHVTQDCNLRCTYCYADHGLYGAVKKDLMTVETVCRYVDLLLAESRDAPEVTFTFFGGEPLMNFPAVREGVLYGERQAAARGKRIRFNMTTNGTLFDDEKIDFCLEHEIHVTLSIDGNRELNDTQRPGVGGTGSYDRTLRRTDRLRRVRRVPARVTITRRQLGVYDIVHHLLAVGFAEVGVTPVATLNSHLDLTGEEMAIFVGEMERTAEVFVDEARQGRFFGFTNVISLIRQFHEGAARGHPCGAGAGLLAGNVDGELYACHRNVNDADYLLGHLDQGVFAAERSRFLADVHVSRKLPCQSCWLRSLCAGGCYYLGSLYEGDRAATFTRQCDAIRRWYLSVLKAYLTIQEANPSFIERLVGEPVLSSTQ